MILSPNRPGIVWWYMTRQHGHRIKSDRQSSKYIERVNGLSSSMRQEQYPTRDLLASDSSPNWTAFGYGDAAAEFLSSLARRLPDGYRVHFTTSANSSGVRVSGMIERISAFRKLGA